MNIRAFSDLGNQALLRRLAEEVAHNCESTATLIALIAEVDERRLFLPAGYPSMLAYCMRELHLSRAAALKRIDAGRAARQFEGILGAVADGRLHLSAVLLLAPRLTRENADELLAAATHKTREEVEQLIAARFPRPDLPTRLEAITPPLTLGSEPGATNVQEQSKSVAPGRLDSAAPRTKLAPFSADSYAVQVTIGRGTHDVLCYVQALLGHAVPSRDLAEVLDRALKALAAQLEKQKFCATRRPRRGLGRTSANPRHIPASVKCAVWQRDGGQCGFVGETGNRCPARTGLEFDHVDPVARGGEATVENVRLRCRAHNQYEAECVFGAGFMSEKRAEARARAKARKQAKMRAAAEETQMQGAAAEARARDAAPDRSPAPANDAASRWRPTWRAVAPISGCRNRHAISAACT